MKNIIFFLFLTIFLPTEIFAWNQNPALQSAEVLVRNIVHHLKATYVRDVTEAGQQFNENPTRRNAENVLRIHQAFLALLPEDQQTALRVAIAASYFLIWETDKDDMGLLVKSADMWIDLQETDEDFVTPNILELQIVSTYGAYMVNQSRTDYLEKCAEFYEAADQKFPDQVPTRALYNVAMCYTGLSKNANDADAGELIDKSADLFHKAHKRGDFEPSTQAYIMGVMTLAARGAEEWGKPEDLDLASIYFGKLNELGGQFNFQVAVVSNQLISLSNLSGDHEEIGKRIQWLLLMIVEKCGISTPKVILDRAVTCVIEAGDKKFPPGINSEVLDIYLRVYQDQVSLEVLRLSAFYHFSLYEKQTNNFVDLAKAARRYERAIKASKQDGDAIPLFEKCANCWLILARNGYAGSSGILKATEFYDKLLRRYRKIDYPQLGLIVYLLYTKYEQTKKTSDLLKTLEYMRHLFNNYPEKATPEILNRALDYSCVFLNSAPGQADVCDEIADAGLKSLGLARNERPIRMRKDYFVKAVEFCNALAKRYPDTERYKSYAMMSESIVEMIEERESHKKSGIYNNMGYGIQFSWENEL